MEQWFIISIGIVGLASSLLIVGLVTLRSVLEVAHMFNFLPPRWQRLFVDREEQSIERVLTRTGLIKVIPQLRELRAWLDIDASELATTFRTVTKRMIEATLVKGDHVIGRDVSLRSPYYVALREKLISVVYATTAARAMAAFIREEIEKSGAESIEYDAVAGIRDGSPIFASVLADVLHRPCILIGERAYVRRETGDDQPVIESVDLDQIHSAIIVDDSSTDGYMVMTAANALRKHGITVKHAFVIFRRAEGDAPNVLAQNDVRLHAIAVVGTVGENKELNIQI